MVAHGRFGIARESFTRVKIMVDPQLITTKRCPQRPISHLNMWVAGVSHQFCDSR